MTIDLSERLTRQLESASREHGITPSELAERLIDRALALDELNAQRRRLEPYVNASGFKSEEDIFRAIS